MLMRFISMWVAILFTCLFSGSSFGGQPGGTKPGPASVVQGELEASTKLVKEDGARWIKELEAIEAMEKKGATPEAVVRAQNEAWARYCKPVARSADRLLDVARDHPDDPAVVEALTYVVMTTRSFATDQSRRAVIVLLQHHVRDSQARLPAGRSSLVLCPRGRATAAGRPRAEPESRRAGT